MPNIRIFRKSNEQIMNIKKIGTRAVTSLSISMVLLSVVIISAARATDFTADSNEVETSVNSSAGFNLNLNSNVPVDLNVNANTNSNTNANTNTPVEVDVNANTPADVPITNAPVNIPVAVSANVPVQVVNVPPVVKPKPKPKPKPVVPANTNTPVAVLSVTGEAVSGATSKTGLPVFSGTALPGATVIVRIDGQVAGSVVAGPDGVWVFTPATPLANGEHTVVVESNGQLSAPAVFGVQVPDIGSRIAVTAPVTGGTVDSSTPVLGGTALPGSRITIAIDGQAAGVADADSSGNWSYSVAVPLASGEHNLVVVDEAGQTENISFTVVLPLVIPGTVPNSVEPAPIAVLSFLPPQANLAVAKAVAKTAQVAATIGGAYQTQVLDNPAVQTTANVAVAPAATVVATAAATSAVGGVWLWQYLFFFFSQPLALLDRRRIKRWGTVFNGFTRLPIDLATVRLLEASSGRIVRTRVTDREGRFLFIVPAGEYRLEVSKNGLVFPALTLAGQKTIADYGDLYFGGSVSPTGGAVHPNVALEPTAVDDQAKIVASARNGRYAKHLVASASSAVSAVAAIASPNAWTILNLAVQIFLVFAIERYVSKKRVAKPGQVLGPEGKPVRAVVRLFESAYDKLVETAITDASGQFVFLVGPNKYYLTAEAPNCGRLKTDVYDLTAGKTVLALDPQLKLPAQA